jgi:flagellar motility protein MotE (MotC chaperone)
MAKKNNAKEKAPKAQGSDKKGESDGLLHGLLTVSLSILIVLVVFGGAFYFVLKNNVYGLGEEFRPSLERIPVLKLALPPLPADADPFDPKHLTQKELLEKYNLLRNMQADLAFRLESAQAQVAALENEKQQWVGMKEDAEATRLENENTKKQLEQQLAEIEADKKELSRLIAAGNKEGFKDYFGKIDPETAKEIYRELAEEEVVAQEYKDLAKPYVEMDPANAAAILTELGSNDMPTVINLIGAMKTDKAAEIIESMEPKFAAELMKKLAEKKLGD